MGENKKGRKIEIQTHYVIVAIEGNSDDTLDDIIKKANEIIDKYNNQNNNCGVVIYE
jgi:hypothetical protein